MQRVNLLIALLVWVILFVIWSIIPETPTPEWVPESAIMEGQFLGTRWQIFGPHPGMFMDIGAQLGS